MIDVTSECLMTLSAAATRLPHRPHISTLHRWRLRGVGGVRLETCMIGGRRMTSLEAIERFVDAVTQQADEEPQQVRTPRQRQRAIERAEAELGLPVRKPGGKVVRDVK